MHVINFTFTLLDEGASSYSREGNHILAIIKESEQYDSLRLALADLRDEVETLEEIMVEGNTCKIRYFLGGDWKFLAIVTGIDTYSAISDFACIWCKCPKMDCADVTQEWSISDPELGARTIVENLALNGRRRKQFNVSHAPLLPSIPLTYVVIDNLHLSLRVSDVLINRLLDELKRQDAIEEVKKFTNGFEISRHKHLERYEQFVSSLGIPSYKFYVGKNSKVLKVRTLTGPEKLRVMSSIMIKDLLPTLPDILCESIQHLWTELISLNGLFSKRPEDIVEGDIEQYESRSKEWVVRFFAIYHSSLTFMPWPAMLGNS